MKRSTGTWMIAVATAALMMVPAAGRAQTSGSAPPSAESATPNTSPTDPTPTPTGTSPTATPQTPAPDTGEPPDAQESQDETSAVRQHLTAARNTLSEVTQMPAAAQLAGETRTQVSQLISNFNELITTTTDWRAAHAKVEANLTALLGSEEQEAPRPAPAEQPEAPEAVGTTGAADLDPEIRGKLVEFRDHLTVFKEAATGSGNVATRATETDPATASGSTSTGAQPAPGEAPQAAPEAQPSGQGLASDAMRHIEAIEAVLDAAPTPAAGAVGTTGTPQGPPPTEQPEAGGLNAAQVELIRNHLNELRRILDEQK